MNCLRVQSLLLMIVSALILTACGGGGGGSTTPPPVSTPVVISTPSLSAAYNGEDYSTKLTTTGGTAPYTWSVSSGSLPPGLTLSGDTISGQPTQDGTSNFTIMVRDSAAHSATKDFSMTISSRFHFATSTLPNGIKKQPYSATVGVALGTGKVTMTAEPLLSNLTFNNGLVGGASDYAGPTTIVVHATDSATPPVTISKTYHIDFLGFETEVPQEGFAGGNYMQDVWVAGGADPIQWSLVSGSLPPGLTFSDPIPGSGFRNTKITGTPTQLGDYSVQLRVTDSGTPQRSYAYTQVIHIIPGLLKILNDELPRAEIGVPYSVTLQGSGGVLPYTWTTLYSNQLPAGLTLSTSGQITGKPTTQQRRDVVFSLRDSRGTETLRTYSMLVTPALPPRNDSIATATPFPFGASRASLSPFGDPAGTSHPDVDYYKIVSTGGKIVSIAAGPVILFSGTRPYEDEIQPVIEIIDSNGFRYTTCNDPADDNQPAGSPIPSDPTPNGFDDPCMNISSLNPGPWFANLLFRVPGTGTVTFYVRVFDFRGDARPDLVYNFGATEY
jgi:large repetitive protein